MPSFNEFLDVLKTELTEFADYSWKEYKSAAVKDGKKFIDKAKVDLERWTTLLAKGELTKDDFEWLIVERRICLNSWRLNRKDSLR